MLVRFERLTPRLATAEELQARFALSHREAEVARLLARSYGTRDIAKHFHVSLHTARHHIEHVYTKLGAHSRVDVRRVVVGDVID